MRPARDGLAIVLALTGLLAAVSRAQTSRPADSGGPLQGVRIDPNGRTVELDTTVVQTDAALEVLVCLANAPAQPKEHESILATRVRPSGVHAALLALGAAPGRPGRWVAAPDGNDVYMPPDGAKVDIHLRYTDAQGKLHLEPAHEWLVSLDAGRPIGPMEWVFVGSDLTDGGAYTADQTGEIVSVSNFATSVLDVPFASSKDDRLLQFAANPNRVPPKGTAVTVVLTLAADADKADVARAWIDVDRFGRYRLDGVAIDIEDIARWAADFKGRHRRAYVVLRAAPRALVHDVQSLQAILDEAGIQDVEVRMRPVAGQILPRTPQQAAASLAKWRDRFARHKDLIFEPGAQAETILRQIDQRREELGDLMELWSIHARNLSQALRAYQATTRPATGEGEP